MFDRGEFDSGIEPPTREAIRKHIQIFRYFLEYIGVFRYRGFPIFSLLSWSDCARIQFCPYFGHSVFRTRISLQVSCQLAFGFPKMGTLIYRDIPIYRYRHISMRPHIPPSGGCQGYRVLAEIPVFQVSRVLAGASVFQGFGDLGFPSKGPWGATSVSSFLFVPKSFSGN